MPPAAPSDGEYAKDVPLTRAERMLVGLLRFFGVVDLCALAAVVMPHGWMSLLHAAAGLGPLPDPPIIGYLTRSASALYALHGALLLTLSTDIRRYAPLIRFLAAAAIVHGTVLLLIDLASDMPILWVLIEWPTYIAIGTIVLVASRAARRSRDGANVGLRCGRAASSRAE